MFIFTFITKFLLLIDSFFCVKNKKAIGNANRTDRNKLLCFQVLHPSVLNPVEQKQDKKQGNDPMEATTS